MLINLFFRRTFNSSKLRDGIINDCIKFLGTPYKWGGKSPFGFDCSGFVQTVFFTFGIKLPRDSYQQMDYKGLVEIKYSKAQVGDLLFFFDNFNENMKSKNRQSSKSQFFSKFSV